LSAVAAVAAPEAVSLDEPPSGLSDAAKAFWRETVGEFELERHHVATLNEALYAWDRSAMARIIVDREGVTVRDRFGQVRVHPAVAVERDSRGQFLRAMRELDVDGAGDPDVRPPRAPRNR